MNIRRNLKPGQKGTKKLVDIYGDSLVCVRYRYDEKRKKRLKTVELIVDESDWEPQKKKSVTDSRIVGIRIGIGETDLQDKVRMPAENGIETGNYGQFLTEKLRNLDLRIGLLKCLFPDII